MPKKSVLMERKAKRAAQRMKMPKSLRLLSTDDLAWQVRIMLTNHEMACDLLSESDIELQKTKQRMKEMKVEFLRKLRQQAQLMSRVRSELEMARATIRELRSEKREARALALAAKHAQVGVAVVSVSDLIAKK